jgi:STE24 endopeptidase
MATGPNIWTRYTDRFPSLHYAMSGVLLFLLFALSPLFVRLLFPRVPLQQYDPESPLIAPLGQMANRANVTLGRVDVWRTGAMRMANAAVTGIWGGHRRVFVTDSLLRELPVPELLAVLAHEMGHVHFRHLLINFLLAISTGMVSIWFIWLVADFVSSELILTLGIFGLQIGYILVVFSFFLRRFEHQADLYAAHIVGRPDWICNALLRLAHVNGTPMTKSSITHPSIHSRIDRIRWEVDKNGLDLSGPLTKFKLFNIAVVCAVFLFIASTVVFVELAA